MPTLSNQDHAKLTKFLDERYAEFYKIMKTTDAGDSQIPEENYPEVFQIVLERALQYQNFDDELTNISENDEWPEIVEEFRQQAAKAKD